MAIQRAPHPIPVGHARVRPPDAPVMRGVPRCADRAMGPTFYAVAAALLILVETALVAWLFVHRAAGQRAQRLLEERLRFEMLLAELSARLIHVPAGGIDLALRSALERMLAFLDM